MSPIIFPGSVVVLDLDDTLYKEVDFLKSGYRKIADSLLHYSFEDPYEDMLAIYRRGGAVFQEIIEKYNYPFTAERFLAIYRNHLPDILLSEEVWEFLQKLDLTGCKTGLITDGRSVMQRNKLKALGLENYFDKVIISEEFGSSKPALENYEAFAVFEGQKYYIADNPSKDFISPNAMGWETICLLDDGQNIHKQDFSLPKEYLPKFKIHNFREVIFDNSDPIKL